MGIEELEALVLKLQRELAEMKDRFNDHNHDIQEHSSTETPSNPFLWKVGDTCYSFDLEGPQTIAKVIDGFYGQEVELEGVFRSKRARHLSRVPVK